MRRIRNTSCGCDGGGVGNIYSLSISRERDNN